MIFRFFFKTIFLLAVLLTIPLMTAKLFHVPISVGAGTVHLVVGSQDERCSAGSAWTGVVEAARTTITQTVPLNEGNEGPGWLRP